MFNFCIWIFYDIFLVESDTKKKSNTWEFDFSKAFYDFFLKMIRIISIRWKFDDHPLVEYPL